jgi:predicted TIM-barrel fold metal-dependent hydrolase
VSGPRLIHDRGHLPAEGWGIVQAAEGRHGLLRRRRSEQSSRAFHHRDAHRHLGVLPGYPFYGGPPVRPDLGARETIAQLVADLDAEGTERALVLPNYGVPDPDVAFAFNELVVAAAATDDRIRAGLWVSPRPQDAERTTKALVLAGEPGVRALKLSFLLGGRADDDACRPALEQIFTVARSHDLVVHVHTSPGASSDVDHVGRLVEAYGDDVAIHLVHLGGGVSGHIKLIGGRFFDWIAAGKRVYTDTSWAIGFAPRWLVHEIERRGIGHDRVLFASDQPWGDFAGEYARLAAAAGDGELGRRMFRDTFDRLYG